MKKLVLLAPALPADPEPRRFACGTADAFVLASFRTTVAALQTVGACLVIAMVVTPGATAYLLTDRFGRLIIISIAIGATTSFVGAYISYFLDGATGGVIVTLQSVLFIAAFYFAPKHGVLAAQERPRPRADQAGDLARAPGSRGAARDAQIEEPRRQHPRAAGNDRDQGKMRRVHCGSPWSQCVTASPSSGSSASSRSFSSGANGASTNSDQSPVPGGSGPTPMRSRA